MWSSVLQDTVVIALDPAAVPAALSGRYEVYALGDASSLARGGQEVLRAEHARRRWAAHDTACGVSDRASCPECRRLEDAFRAAEAERMSSVPPTQPWRGAESPQDGPIASGDPRGIGGPDSAAPMAVHGPARGMPAEDGGGAMAGSTQLSLLDPVPAPVVSDPAPNDSPWPAWLAAQPWRVVRDVEGWLEALAAARAAGVAAFDTETAPVPGAPSPMPEAMRGLDPYAARIRLMQLAVPSSGRIVVDAAPERFGREVADGAAARAWVLDLDALAPEDRRAALEAAAELVADRGVTVVGAHLAFDLKILRAALDGRRFSMERLFDVLLAARVAAAGDYVAEPELGAWLERNGLAWADRAVCRAAGENGKFTFCDRHGHLITLRRETGAGHRKERLLSSYSLQALAHRHLEVWLDKSLQASGWDGALSEERLHYAANDVLVLLPLYEILRRVLRENGLEAVAGLEMTCLPATVELELAGMPFDAAAARELVAAERAKQEAAAARLRGVAAECGFRPRADKRAEFSADAQEDCAAVLRLLAAAESLLEGAHIAAGGERFLVATDDDTLSRLRARLDEESRLRGFLCALQDYRTAKKRADMVEGYLKLVHPATGRVHAGYHQMGTAAGRYSSSDPNLQNVPGGKDVRALFRAPDGRALAIADLAAIEMRIMAELSGDARLCAVFAEGRDPHRATAALVAGKPESEVSKEERARAKPAGFGLIYGMSPDGLRRYAETGYGVRYTPEEAERICEVFFGSYVGVRRWHDRQRRAAFGSAGSRHVLHSFARGLHAEPRAVTSTLGGRRRVWPLVTKLSRAGKPYTDKHGSVTEAYNSPDQGTGADILKWAMAALYRELVRRGWDDVLLCATVHDELLVEAPIERVEAAAKLVKACLEAAGGQYMKRVPCVAEAAAGQSWADKG